MSSHPAISSSLPRFASTLYLSCGIFSSLIRGLDLASLYELLVSPRQAPIDPVACPDPDPDPPHLRAPRYLIIPQALAMRHGICIGATRSRSCWTRCWGRMIGRGIGIGSTYSPEQTAGRTQVLPPIPPHGRGAAVRQRDNEISNLNGMLELNMKHVEEIMMLMADVVTLSASALLSPEIVDTLILSGYLRFLVHYRKDPCACVGLLLLKGQTGRVHLLLISRTPRKPGSGIGVITLEDIIKILSEEIVGQSEQDEGEAEHDRGCYASCMVLSFSFIAFSFFYIRIDGSDLSRIVGGIVECQRNASRARSVRSSASCPFSAITIRDEGEQDGERAPLRLGAESEWAWRKGRGEESAESGGGGINKAVFISPFQDSILRVCGWRKSTLMVLDSRQNRGVQAGFRQAKWTFKQRFEPRWKSEDQEGWIKTHSKQDAQPLQVLAPHEQGPKALSQNQWSTYSNETTDVLERNVNCVGTLDPVAPEPSGTRIGDRKGSVAGTEAPENSKNRLIMVLYIQSTQLAKNPVSIDEKNEMGSSRRYPAWALATMGAAVASTEDRMRTGMPSGEHDADNDEGKTKGAGEDDVDIGI
ncbi:hypothetical protein B0H14DRAFT_3615283 [Mycena olivaceomarginata]|nr:hypothetical protein B0H14DRAFT_3615283 [Mycena olivaceomarginata]